MATLTLDADTDQLTATHPDGGTFEFGMMIDRAVTLADTRTELVEQLIDGYAELPDTDEGDAKAFELRYVAAVQVANAEQELLLAQATNSGMFDPSLESEDTLTAFFTPRNERLDDIASWDHDQPLVLVTTSYIPYTTQAPPSGNVRWVDPRTETTFLDTLGALGAITLLNPTDS
ncbi:hypothetical protein [Arthrobacter sp. A2-55]|uniref:hypothetical protein n=1 Tax=Arthrobacter sp. A2-55 TaxID=2897337 RepID=UPI0021CD50BA|nr:hypothetical protein [Arthrobacter sp. A2-55]MCU6480546.1 hypothetical protein [Arthrobacter sp. A2-55]